jgi:two-component system response regulator WspF
VRIGIAESRPDAAGAITVALTRAATHQILWTTANGFDALALCVQDPPDLVLLDLQLAGGLQASRQIAERAACAVVIVTDSLPSHAAQVCEALGHGALDVVERPVAGDGRCDASGLCARVDAIAHLIGRATPRERQPIAPAAGPLAPTLVSIGAGAGGPAALAAILGRLPADFPAAVVVLQHADTQFALGMASWLGGLSPLPVRVAAHGDRPTAGTVLLAGGDEHLMLTPAARFGYSREPLHSFYRPSIDAFFHSVVDHWRGDAVGVLLTGMGRDGALGLKAMRAAGLYTIVQDEATSAAWGMPKAASLLDAAVDVLGLDVIASSLVDAVRREQQIGA